MVKSSDDRTDRRRRPLHKRVAAHVQLAVKRPRIKSALVLHESRFTKGISPNILIPMLCWPNKGRFRKPDNLAILLLHNRDYKTILEQSLDYLGIEGYSVIRPHLPRGIWRNTLKIRAALDFARHCAEEYILYVDSDDAIMVGDPQRAIELLQDSGGEMLFSTTKARSYQLMPEREAWFRQLADDAGWSRARNVNINSGVYVARREPLIEILEAVAEYVTDDDLSPEEFKVKREARTMPEFPLGCGSDQNIFRFLYPRFADIMRIDYAAKLAVR